MLEMASMGAKVLQIRSVEFAKKYNVPVHVRSTFSDDPGTLVAQEDAMMEAVLVSGIAYDKDQARVTVCGVPDPPPAVHVQLRTSEHRSMYSYVRLSIIDVQLRTSDIRSMYSCTSEH